RQLSGAAGDRRRLPRRLWHPGQLPQRRHGDRLELDLQLGLGHSRRRRRHPGDELRRALRRDRRGDRHRLLDQPAAGHLGLERPLCRCPRLLGLRLGRRQSARRLLLRRRESEQPGAERETATQKPNCLAGGSATEQQTLMQRAKSPISGKPPHHTRRLRRWVPGLELIQNYPGQSARPDLVAGAVLAAILVPQGMAYAELAGLPAVTGLYTTIACLVGYALFGPSRVLVLGPDSSISPLILAAIAPLLVVDDPGSA